MKSFRKPAETLWNSPVFWRCPLSPHIAQLQKSPPAPPGPDCTKISYRFISLFAISGQSTEFQQQGPYAKTAKVGCRCPWGWLPLAVVVCGNGHSWLRLYRVSAGGCPRLWAICGCGSLWLGMSGGRCKAGTRLNTSKPGKVLAQNTTHFGYADR